MDDALRGSPELPRRLENLDAVILQRSAEEQTIGVYGVRGGWLAEPMLLQFAEIAGQPRSAEHILREYLENLRAGVSTGEAPEKSRGKDELGENLWLLARWFYSNPREGEIFFREKDWPYRRMLRGCSRLLALNDEKKG